jgi:hypothetical protein
VYKDKGNRDTTLTLYYLKGKWAAAGLSPKYYSLLANSTSDRDSVLTIASYIESARLEVNPSDNYRSDVIKY